MVELRKHEVPYFEETLVFPAGIHFGIGQVAVSLAAVVENFGTRSARTFADIPEVILQLDDALGRQSDFFVPQLKCFFVFRIYRDGEALRIEADPFLA